MDENFAVTVNRKEQMPEEEHYAILTFVTVHIPGDLRSQQMPGHGYPAHDEPYTQYTVYPNQEAWHKAIIELEKWKKPYIPLRSKPVSITVQTTITEEQ